MKTQPLGNIVLFSLVLTIILSFYFISTVDLISLKNLGLIVGILLVSYFLFINVTFHYVDFRDNLKLKRIRPENHQNIIIPGLKKSTFIFLGILIFISILTYLNIRFVQMVPFFIDKEYNYLIVIGLLFYLLFQEVQKHSASTK
jgi:phosphatidylserine synthase